MPIKNKKNFLLGFVVFMGFLKQIKKNGICRFLGKFCYQLKDEKNVLNECVAFL